jgi:hypothetical protein
MSRLYKIATEIGELVERKNAAYGSSFAKSGAALRLLYPAGVQPEQLDDALLIARIWDKLQRIATDRDALGESPYRDIAGYGILGASLHDQTGEHDGTQAAVPAMGMRKRSDQRSEILLTGLPDGGLESAPWEEPCA